MELIKDTICVLMIPAIGIVNIITTWHKRFQKHHAENKATKQVMAFISLPACFSAFDAPDDAG